MQSTTSSLSPDMQRALASQDDSKRANEISRNRVRWRAGGVKLEFAYQLQLRTFSAVRFLDSIRISCPLAGAPNGIELRLMCGFVALPH